MNGILDDNDVGTVASTATATADTATATADTASATAANADSAVVLKITKNSILFNKNSYTVTVLAQTGEGAPKIDRHVLVNLVNNDTNTIFLKKNNDEPIRLTSDNIDNKIQNVNIFTIPTTNVQNTTIDIGTGLLHPGTTTGATTTTGGKRKTKRKRSSYKKSARRKHRS
jgi:hypothetical protein